MKYCPKCGAELPDEANFCPKCGAKQPAFEVNEPVEENKLEVAPAKVAEPQTQSMNPRQRYNYLVKNDEVFKEIVVFRRKKYLFELIFVSFFITWLVAMFTPIAVYSGKNVSTEGMYYLTYPYKVSPYSLIYLKQLAGNRSLAPGGLNDVFAMMMLIFGYIFMVLLIVLPLVKAFTGKGYVLKQYEEGKVKELIQDSIRPFWVGALFNVVVLTPAINLFFIAHDPTYREGDVYLFGEIKSIPSAFVVVILVGLFITAINIVLTVVLGNVFSKKLRTMLKNL